MVEKSIAIQRLNDSRRMFLQAIEGLNSDQLSQLPVMGDWTISDIIAHLESWERASLEPMQAFLDQGTYQAEVIPDDLVWNDQQFARWQNISLADRQQAHSQTHLALIQSLEALPDDRWQKTVTFPWREQGTLLELVGGLVWHEQQHLKYILGWLDKRDNS